jgi:hypothetical protein
MSRNLFYLHLTLNPLTWKIWRTPNNANRWQKGFNLAFKGLKHICFTYIMTMEGKGIHVDTRQRMLCLYKESKFMSMQVTGRNLRDEVH